MIPYLSFRTNKYFYVLLLLIICWCLKHAHLQLIGLLQFGFCIVKIGPEPNQLEIKSNIDAQNTLLDFSSCYNSKAMLR